METKTWNDVWTEGVEAWGETNWTERDDAIEQVERTILAMAKIRVDEPMTVIDDSERSEKTGLVLAWGEEDVTMWRDGKRIAWWVTCSRGASWRIEAEVAGRVWSACDSGLDMDAGEALTPGGWFGRDVPKNTD